MKDTQILKYQGRELYTLGLKLIFIYAEYSGPALFASLMNLCSKGSGVAKSASKHFTTGMEERPYYFI